MNPRLWLVLVTIGYLVPLFGLFALITADIGYLTISAPIAVVGTVAIFWRRYGRLER